MSPLLQRKSMRGFIGAIAGVGLLRFALTLAGMPDGQVKYVSMTVVILAGALYFAIATATHRERLYAAYFLILPYMVVEVLALAYTWVSGQPTIFHSVEYSFGLSMGSHLIGHLVGGLTWEPLFLFLLMEAVWLVYKAVAVVILRK
jgi:hypothetical protein